MGEKKIRQQKASRSPEAFRWPQDVNRQKHDQPVLSDQSRLNIWTCPQRLHASICHGIFILSLSGWIVVSVCICTT
jgi:hypothetical protein